MESQRWEVISRIFNDALELKTSERRAYVDAETAGDPELRAEVERMLKADAEAGTWLAAGPVLTGLDWDGDAGLVAGQLAGITPGAVLSERFEVRRLIAEGGMGSVYEAYDRELQTVVALKVILPEIAANPEVLNRFRREVALARRVTHANICRTFDLERTEYQGREIVFLTMEFLAGSTLAAYLKQTGALGRARVLEIGSQVAQALEAAHALGVLHRDIKPGNIMLVPDAAAPAGTRVVVMDFGLARLELESLAEGGEEAAGLTRSGYPIGTLAYMAPEQLEGSTARTSTDVYALGLVLVEMLTGQRVFASLNPLSGMVRRLQAPPQLRAVLPADVPVGWTRALERSLSLAPEDRQQSAAALIQELAAANGPESRFGRWRGLVGNVARKQVGTLHRRPGTLLTGSAVFLVLVSLLLLSARFGWVKPSSKTVDGALVYVAPLENRTGMQALDHAGSLLTAQLSQSVHINLLDDARVGEILQTMTKSREAAIDPVTAREIAQRSGAVRVVFPVLTRRSDGYTLTIDIQQPELDPARYRTHWVKTFSWREDGNRAGLDNGALSAMRDAGDWIREKVGESSQDIARLNVPPEDATTGNWQALDDYAHAETLLAQGRTDDGITALERATQQDGDFSLAYARLGDVLFSVGRWEDGLAAYRKAMSATGRQRLTRRELDRVRGIYAIDTYDYTTAEAQFRDLTSYYPNDRLGWFYRANPLMRLGRTDEAIECLKKALALKPDSVNTVWTLAFYSYIAGDTTQAARWTAELHRMGANNEASWVEGEGAALAGDLEGAAGHFAMAEKAANKRLAIAGYEFMGHLLAERGEFSAAMVELEKGIRETAPLGDTASEAQLRMDHAWLACETKDYTGCLSDVERSLQLDNSPKQLRMASMTLGTFAAQAPAGPARQMRSMLDENRKRSQTNETGPAFSMAELESAGELALVNGDCDAALKALRAESLLDSTVAARDYLGRGLRVCAAREPDATRARALRDEAAQAYAYGAFAPALLWFELKYHPPGDYAEQLGGWLSVAAPDDTRRAQAQQSLLRLRPQDAATFAHAAGAIAPPAANRQRSIH